MRAALIEIDRPIAVAAKGAMLEFADNVKREARADIARAGFGKRWQNAFRVDVYPQGSKRVSSKAAALIYHKIPYADVFEAGATIRGKSKLWIPLSSTPKKVGSKRMTPKLYTQAFGPLVTMNIRGKTFLGGKVSLSKAQAKSGQVGKVTTARLRKGGQKSNSGATPTRTVPLFIGVDSVSIKKRFSIRQITGRAAGRLAELYAKHLLIKD
ncbi:DUF6441 family protein [Pseudaminobacter soli (ex Li et al. 2025)]|uniref:DUF6441 family protein n=1 Tax=Pseudaminobacter soli (ex Li et al. 2025) TaxID=1295366 RepID=UPI0011B1D255|nr:DUF6441 family protein [Mesorhizobium soli]